MHSQEKRPTSAVSDVSGLVGMIGLCVGLAVAFQYKVAVIPASFLLFVCTAVPMIVCEVLVFKVHLRTSTGLDYSLKRPWGEVKEIARVKFIGLGATFALFGFLYFILRSYRDPSFELYFLTLQLLLPFLMMAAPFYIALTTRHMTTPKDGLWHFGKLVCGDFALVDKAQVKNYLLSWCVKAFFLAFMVSIFPRIVLSVLNGNWAVVFSDPITTALLLLQLTYLFDVCFGTVGYVMTFRVLDSHIRSANPYWSGWIAALICYPPFVLMGKDGPLFYHEGTQLWHVWFEGEPVLLALWGGVMVALMVVYAWATVAFGIRFSNLTHRGIITTGPYRFFKHPAYLTKNIMWWMSTLPFLTTSGSWEEGLRNSILLASVSLIYFLRAKTEEKHLMSDPAYQDYSNWIAHHGVVSRVWMKKGASHKEKAVPLVAGE